VISFRARHRQVVRQERADQIRRDIREQVEQLDRCDAGDPDPWHMQRPGEPYRAYRRRIGRPDLAKRQAALLLAEGYWDADRPLPGTIREALCALSLSPRELRRVLVSVWGHRDWRLRDFVPYWVPVLAELAIRLGRVERWLETCLHTGPPTTASAIFSPVSTTACSGSFRDRRRL
jgi:hypothetical protein